MGSSAGVSVLHPLARIAAADGQVEYFHVRHLSNMRAAGETPAAPG